MVIVVMVKPDANRLCMRHQPQPAQNQDNDAA